MSQATIDPDYRKMRSISHILVSLLDLPKVDFEYVNDKYVFYIRHPQQFVPDWKFEWCSTKKHYRVYILVGDRDREKSHYGYTVCTVGSRFAATGFCVLYGFLHKHRANNKEESFS